jgi:mRNA-degrading endonuclease toxin of MazEF toxin-antitoxin module
MVNFHPGRGSEQEGVRPAVVIQNDVGNRYAVNLAQILTVDRARLQRRVGMLTPERIEMVDAAIRV